MKRKLLLGLAALFLLASCDSAPEQIAKAKEVSGRQDAPEMPKVEGCTLQRYVVGIPHPAGPDHEVVYVALCQPTKTVSTSMTRNCGKNCTQRITTVTTTEGVPEEKQ